jgi:hypothetical protein
MKQLSPAARRLFELSRGQDEPDALARNRVGRALSVRIASGASASAMASSVSGSAAGILGSAVAKSVLVASVTTALVAAGWLTSRSFRHPLAQEKARSEVEASEATSTAAHPAAKPRLEEKPSPEQPAAHLVSDPSGAAPTRRQPVRPSMRVEPKASAPARTPEAMDRLHAETDALRSAQRALRDRKPRQALELLDEQDARFRDGILAQERAAARILALCQAGLAAKAHEQAERFERLWPGSALVGRVRSACRDR